jgi:ceramide glucosyltransferase
MALSLRRRNLAPMTDSAIVAALFCGIATFLHVLSVVIAALRCRPRIVEAQFRDPSLRHLPPVSVIRPVCGLENFAAETLRTSFELAYPDFELVFCVASGRDPVIALVRDLIAAHPHVTARLLIGDDPVSVNPKLNNCVKGWRAAAHDWIVIADSNVLMPSDYLQRLLATWTPDTGLVCSPPAGCRPEGFWANLECAFLNTYQARIQYFADTLGIGFAQGKTMLWRRHDLEAAGGIKALGAEIAEDAASTKVVRAAGLRVRLVDAPFGQPLGRRRMAEVWRRQTRWARLRRASFPLFFVPEIFGGAVFPLLAAGYAAHAAGVSTAGAVAALAIVWYGAEMALMKIARWHLTPLYPLHALVRDLMLPGLWIDGWIGTDFVWRGNQMSIAADSPTA